MLRIASVSLHPQVEPVDQASGPTGYSELSSVATRAALKEPGAKNQGGAPPGMSRQLSNASSESKLFGDDKARLSAAYVASQALPDYGGALLAPSVRIGGRGKLPNLAISICTEIAD